jgi:hypothetical protein
VVHGPWLPADCAAVLGRWLERGWLALYRGIEDPAALTAEESSAILADPGHWALGTTTGLVVLTATEAGATVPMLEWLDAARSVID